MSTINSAPVLIRPKPVKPSVIGLHPSRSQIFQEAKFAASPPLPIMLKSKSAQLVGEVFRAQGPSLEELAGIPFEEDCGRIEEVLQVERELKAFYSPQLAPVSFSEALQRDGGNSPAFRKSCPFIPPRPSNPMVKDKLWANDENSSSTEEDSDGGEEEAIVCKEEVGVEGNTQHV